jgi:hypothetical protein
MRGEAQREPEARGCHPRAPQLTRRQIPLCIPTSGSPASRETISTDRFKRAESLSAAQTRRSREFDDIERRIVRSLHSLAGLLIISRVVRRLIYGRAGRLDLLSSPEMIESVDIGAR